MQKEFKGKAIYNPSGRAGEYSYWACNFYVGCSNGCEYCYCKKGILGKAMGQDKPQLKKCFKDEVNALEIFEKELKQNLAELQKHGLFFSFTTDPLLAKCSDLTWEAAMFAMVNDVPVKILTKVVGVWVTQIIAVMHPSWKGKGLISFGFTLTGHDELEPNASTNTERIDAMKKLHDAGFKIFASIEPIVDFASSMQMIEQTLGFCDLYKIGLMSGKKYDTVELQSFVEWLNELDGVKIYLKESLLKQSRYTLDELDNHFVSRDYNLFKQ